MKSFLIKINAYDYFTQFQVKSDDDPVSLEKAILDKLGENDIVWEFTGDMYDSRKHRITYEEVIDGQPHSRALPTEKSSRQQVGAGT
tara:strand:- start:180 stop:440 length:261 start_codon:yes stop_codon:yes gene_type:complete